MITATEVSADDGLQRFRIDVVTETIGYLMRQPHDGWNYETAAGQLGVPFLHMGRSEALNMLLLATGTWPRLLPALFREAATQEPTA
jgi:hypothetical protein